jgi:hypothetical protein
MQRRALDQLPKGLNYNKLSVLVDLDFIGLCNVPQTLGLKGIGHDEDDDKCLN